MNKTVRTGPLTVAVTGATGPVGRELIEILGEREFPVGAIVLLESEQGAGERIEFRGRAVPVGVSSASALSGADIAFLCGAETENREIAPAAVRAGATIIDCAGAFWKDASVPVVVPEVNPEALTGHRGVIANPDCPVIALAMVIKPIRDKVGVRRVMATLFQPVSGSGKDAMDELAGQTVALLNFRDVEHSVYTHQIAFNCIPQCGPFVAGGSSLDEVRTAEETRRVLGDGALPIAATAVRVPVFRGHAAALHLETGAPISANDVRALLSGAAGMLVYDDPTKALYPTAIDVVGKDEVFVGRIREDGSLPHGTAVWLATDNLRKGAALNAVQIAECLLPR